MSDTPRTDAIAIPSPLAMEKHYVAMREHARQLERELNALKHDLERAMENHAADLNAEQSAHFMDVMQQTELTDAGEETEEEKSRRMNLFLENMKLAPRQWTTCRICGSQLCQGTHGAR